MDKWFYIKHRYLELVRSGSQSGAWLVFIFLLIIGLQTGLSIYQEFPGILDAYSGFIGYATIGSATWGLFVLYLLMDFAVKLIFNPLPLKLKHYALLSTNPLDIAVSYQPLSVISPVQFALLLLSIPIVSRFASMIDQAWLIFFLLWFATHFLSVTFHHVKSGYRFAMLGTVVSLVAIHFYGMVDLDIGLSNFLFLGFGLLIIFIISVLTTNNYIKNYRDEEEAGASWLESWLSELAFGSYLMRLEWALMIRNKRTRTNILSGVISIIFIGYMMIKYENINITVFPFFVIGVFMTGFLMIQHGIYTLAWEGNYFDFLISRISLREFILFKYKFFLTSSVLLMTLAMPFFAINSNLFISLLAACCYNISVNSILVLNGALANRVKLDLNRNTLFNYQGLNATLFMNSILIVFLPVFLFAVVKSQINETYVSLVILALCAVLFAFHRPILNKIIRRLESKKYELAKGYRA
jgi:hypothetical protein